MKIFNVSQIVEADRHTIINEPISSINLMERASKIVFEKIVENFSINYNFHIFV